MTGFLVRWQMRRDRAALTRHMEYALQQRADAERTIEHLTNESNRLAVQELNYLITARRPK